MIKYVFDLVSWFRFGFVVQFKTNVLTKGTLRPFLRKMEGVNTHNKTYRYVVGNDFAPSVHEPNEIIRNTVSFIIDLKTKR